MINVQNMAQHEAKKLPGMNPLICIRAMGHLGNLSQLYDAINRNQVEDSKVGDVYKAIAFEWANLALVALGATQRYEHEGVEELLQLISQGKFEDGIEDEPETGNVFDRNG